MSIVQGVTQSPGRTGGTINLDLCDLGVVVVHHNGQVVSSNARAWQLLGAASQQDVNVRVSDLRHRVGQASDERSIDVAGVGPIGVRSYPTEGGGEGGCVLLLRDGRSLDGTDRILQQAARHRAFAFLARDWAHDLKGILHVIRINSALVGRLLQRQPVVVDAAVTRCLDAIPREVERLDRSIDQLFRPKPGDRPAAFDLGATCQRVKDLIAARALRQHVDLTLELNGGSKNIVGFEEQVECALLNVIINALEAMTEHGSLVIRADGHTADVTVRISDTGNGIRPQPDDHRWRPHLVNAPRQTGIGLYVARTIVESHGGRIEYAPNIPRGTSVEMTFPTAASTGRL